MFKVAKHDGKVLFNSDKSQLHNVLSLEDENLQDTVKIDSSLFTIDKADEASILESVTKRIVAPKVMNLSPRI